MNITKVTLSAGLAGLLITGSWIAGLTARFSPVTAQETAVIKRQKNQAERFKRYGSGQDLRERAIKESGEIVVVESAPIPFDMPGRPAVINAIACDADTIVIGKIKNRSSSQLTEGGGFVFTIYHVAVEEVIKDNPAAPLQTGGTLIVSQPGGEVKFNGKSIRAIDESFRPFAEHGQYILFLRHNPSTGHYDAFSNGSFQVQDDQVSPQGEGTQGQRVKGGKADFITLVKQAVASPCPTRVDALME